MPERRYVKPVRRHAKIHILRDDQTPPRRTICGLWLKDFAHQTIPKELTPADWELCWCCRQGDKLR